MYDIWLQSSREMYVKLSNVGKTIIHHPFGNGLYHLSMVIWGLFIIVLHTVCNFEWRMNSSHSHLPSGDFHTAARTILKKASHL